MLQTIIALDPTHHAVTSALTDAQRMHRLVTGLLEQGRKEANLLYRCRAEAGSVILYLQAEHPVKRVRLLPFMCLAAEFPMDPMLERLHDGQTHDFSLITMPFKKISDNNGGNSRRRMLTTYAERLAWLERKAAQNGFSLRSVIETPSGTTEAIHKEEKGGALRMNTFCYEGTLQITDELSFRNDIRCGIGPGKAYGYGMLLLSMAQAQ